MKRRLLVGLLVLFVALLIGLLATPYLSLDAVAAREQWLRGLIISHPWQSWLTGFAVYFVASLIPGTRGKAIVCGWLFGFWFGLVLVNLALTAAAIVTFLVSRYLVRDAIQERYHRKFLRINQALEQEGAWYVLLLRVVPVSFSLTNYLLGATNVNTKTYWWASQLGMLPGNAAFVFLGAGLPSLSEIARNGVAALISWELIAALTLFSLFPLVAHRVVRRYQSNLHLMRAPQSPSM
jgi:uncharacterized membrane protein YdjX (TVP38/TMEM64 family)